LIPGCALFCRPLPRTSLPLTTLQALSIDYGPPAILR
jgi:hypothetical protein